MVWGVVLVVVNATVCRWVLLEAVVNTLTLLDTEVVARVTVVVGLVVVFFLDAVVVVLDAAAAVAEIQAELFVFIIEDKGKKR